GTSDYNVPTREDTFAMARTVPADARTQQAIFRKRLKSRGDPLGPSLLPTLVALVFLSSNLSTRVIDPYRDACNVAGSLVGSVSLTLPCVVAGFDDAPGEVFAAVQDVVRASGTAYLGRQRPAADVPWLQVAVRGQDVADS